jgi:hypothetical protein
LSASCPIADVTGDGQVHSGDLQQFITAYLANTGGYCWHVLLHYDYRNRLVAWTEVSDTSQRSGIYSYDALGRRISKRADTDGDGDFDEEVRFVYGGEPAWQLIEEWPLTASPSQPNRSYVYGNYIDELIQTRVGASTDYYHHQDDLYSIVATTNAAGAVVERYQYGDYGDRRVFDAAGNTREYSLIGPRHGFTGQLHPTHSWDEAGRDRPDSDRRPSSV